MSSAKVIGSLGNRGPATLLTNPDGASLKRIAWAFGCSKKDSDEERALYYVLLERVNKERAA